MQSGSSRLDLSRVVPSDENDGLLTHDDEKYIEELEKGPAVSSSRQELEGHPKSEELEGPPKSDVLLVVEFR